MKLNNVSGFTGTVQLSNSGTTGDKWMSSGAGQPRGLVVVDSGSQLFPNTTASVRGGPHHRHWQQRGARSDPHDHQPPRSP
ncbi:MAG: hypothetical protein U1G05_12030 [Kiritimatiellia bacterium]